MIVTRTTEAKGPHLDPWADDERNWTLAELGELIEAYERACKSGAGVRMANLAVELGLDQRQIAIRLIRLTCQPAGDIDDVDAAPRNGTRYTDEDKKLISDLYGKGASLPEMAQALGRTQLGLGWRLIEDFQPAI